MKKDDNNKKLLHEKLDGLDSESVMRMKSNLRDAYMDYKDLSNRCLIDMAATEKNDRRIFYFKPESILLKDMET